MASTPAFNGIVLPASEQQPEPERNLVGDDSQKADHSQIWVDQTEPDTPGGEDAGNLLPTNPGRAVRRRL